MTQEERVHWHRQARIERTPLLTVQWLVASIAGFFAFAYAFGTVLASRQGRTLQPIILGVPDPGTLVLTLLALGGSVAVVVILHEWIHGIFLARYGGDPSYGVGTTYFGLPYVYATVDEGSDEDDEARGEGEAPSNGVATATVDRPGMVDRSDGENEPGWKNRTLEQNGSEVKNGVAETESRPRERAINGRNTAPDVATWGYARNELQVVLLAPFVVLSVLGVVALVLFPSPLLVLILAANAAGSVADLWMAASLLRYPPVVRVGEMADTDGIGVYGPRQSNHNRVFHSVVAPVVRGAIITYAILVGVAGVLVLSSVAFGSGTVIVDVFGRPIVRHEFFPDQGIVLLSADLVTVFEFAIAGGLCWGVVVAVRQRVRRSAE